MAGRLRLLRGTCSCQYVADLRDALLGEYEVEATRLESDLHGLLAQLAGQGLIDVAL